MNGLCKADKDEFTCFCRDGYEGINCEARKFKCYTAVLKPNYSKHCWKLETSVTDDGNISKLQYDFQMTVTLQQFAI